MATILRGELTAGVNVPEGDLWVTSYIIDQLFIQMCDGPLVDHKCNITFKYPKCKYLYLQQISFHYIEVDNYARRISSGNFEGKNAKHKPIFIVNPINFTPKLKEELRIAAAEKTLPDIITEAVFRIFKARHKRIFYEYIEPHKLNWDIEI
jgi:hypothetical protein